jgi:hypothetical protein
LQALPCPDLQLQQCIRIAVRQLRSIDFSRRSPISGRSSSGFGPSAGAFLDRKPRRLIREQSAGQSPRGSNIAELLLDDEALIVVFAIQNARCEHELAGQARK